jgi:hypothetical protein
LKYSLLNFGFHGIECDAHVLYQNRVRLHLIFLSFSDPDWGLFSVDPSRLIGHSCLVFGRFGFNPVSALKYNNSEIFEPCSCSYIVTETCHDLAYISFYVFFVAGRGFMALSDIPGITDLAPSFRSMGLVGLVRDYKQANPRMHFGRNHFQELTPIGFTRLLKIDKLPTPHKAYIP